MITPVPGSRPVVERLKDTVVPMSANGSADTAESSGLVTLEFEPIVPPDSAKLFSLCLVRHLENFIFLT